MSYKDVLKIFKLERELSDGETAFLNTLRQMSDADRELLAETLGPPVKAKVKAGATRKIEKCVACNYTRRAMVHQVPSAEGFHEFQQSSSALKSKRASELAEKVQATTKRVITSDNDSGQPALCTFEIDGKVCKGSENDGIHDATMGYGAYHEFQPEMAQGASGD